MWRAFTLLWHWDAELTSQRGKSIVEASAQVESSSCPTSHVILSEVLECQWNMKPAKRCEGVDAYHDHSTSCLAGDCIPLQRKFDAVPLPKGPVSLLFDSSCLVNPHLVPSLNPQAFALGCLYHVTQSTRTSSDATIRNSSAITIPDSLAMFSQLLTRDHNRH
jgi:hypothetical protein